MEISTLESSYETPLEMQELEYSQNEMSSFSTEDRSKSSSNESIILDFSKLKPHYLETVCEPTMFVWNQSLRMKQKNNEKSGTQIGINVANARLWLFIRRACVVWTLAKFMKNYLNGKNALKNQAGSE